MQSWGDGYITDIEYTDGFYAAQGPRQIAMAALMRGFAAPDFDRPFAYCELGCGRGRTSLVLAALHPESEFHAVDFHPAHIAQAQEEALAAELGNITFHERSFDELLGADAPALPMFDVITMHGVWSWVSSEIQDSIVAFLKARLKPGGMVFVSYNAMPAWQQVAPVQRLLKELAEASPARSDVAIAQSMQTLDRLSKAGVVPDRFSEGLEKILGQIERSQLDYLAHEYLNAHWKPLYHLDVVRSLAPAKLSYAGNMDLLRNFPILGFTPEQLAALDEFPDEALRETLVDFCLGGWFRKDIFVRGARRLTRGAQLERAGELVLTALAPFPEVIQLKAPDGTIWKPDVEVYRAVGEALRSGPRRIKDLLSLPGLPNGHKVSAIELAGLLVGVGLAAVYTAPSAAAVAATQRLNGLLKAPEDVSMTHGVTLAVPTISSGVTLSAADYMIYRMARQGAADVEVTARRFVDRCRRAGGYPIIDGQAYEDEAEAVEATTRNFQEKAERFVPSWRLMGLL
jgi:SAM-dependent methyltransferase